MKKCIKCGRMLPESEFYERKAEGRGRLQSWCKACTKARGKLKRKGYYIMEDYSFFNIKNCLAGRKRLNDNQVSLNNRNNSYTLTFSKKMSDVLIERKHVYLRIRKDNYTGEILFILTENEGLKGSFTNNSRNSLINISFNNKDLILSLIKEFDFKPGTLNQITLSENISIIKEATVYRVLR